MKVLWNEHVVMLLCRPVKWLLAIALLSLHSSLVYASVISYTATDDEGSMILTSVTVKQGENTRIYNAKKLIGCTVTHYSSHGGVSLATDPRTDGVTGDARANLLDARLTSALPNPGAAQEPLHQNPVLSGAARTQGIALTFAEPVVNRPGVDVVLFELHKGAEGDPFHISPISFADGLKGITVRAYDLPAGSKAVMEVSPINLFSFTKPPGSLEEFTTSEMRPHTKKESGFKALAVGIDLSLLGYAPGQTINGLFLQSALGYSSFDPAAVLGLPAPTQDNLLDKEPEPMMFQPEQTEMLEKALNNEAGNFEEIVFAQRVSGRDHWYGNFGHYCETDSPYSKGALTKEGDMYYAFAPGGRLCRYNLRTGKLRVLLDDPEGGIRDPNLYYDASKILFSYRKGNSKTFHLYEIGIDGNNLKQLTDGPDNDIEPIYTPSGKIIFCSSRCHRFVPCWRTQVATLYQCDGDGGNIRMLSNNAEQENTPWMLPDGRVIYMRWEYVDRHMLLYHHLWTINSDGTGVMVYFGNQFKGYAMLDAKPIPGTRNIAASFSPGHGMAEHMGWVTVVDPRNGPDDMSMAQRIGKRMYRDPYPISQKYFLVADERGIHLLDHESREQTVFLPSDSGSRWACHEPRPLRKRPLESVIPDRTDLASATGQLLLSDIYYGRNMKGVEKGEITQLLVLEQLAKPANFSNAQDPLTIGGTFTLQRILGTVPVEPDGSANMELPAMRSLFFIALDKDGHAVKRMHSFVTVQPGEVTGCVGCHELRTQAPHFNDAPQLMAAKQAPSRITAIPNIPDVLDFPRDIQPILDRHCIKCHNTRKRPNGIDLSGDHTPIYSISYWTMFTHKLVRDGRNLYGNTEPHSIGAAASPIMDVLNGLRGHGDRVKISEKEKNIVRFWIESGAVYPGTYGALGSGVSMVKFPKENIRRRCASCHEAREKSYRNVKEGAFYYQFGSHKPPQPLLDDLSDIILLRHLAYFQLGESRLYQSLCNLDRPEESLLLLAPLTKEAGGLSLCGDSVFKNTEDKDYQTILATIRDASKELQNKKRFDMTGFQPNRYYIREMKNYGVLPADLSPNEAVDPYTTDRAYWETFTYKP